MINPGDKVRVIDNSTSFVQLGAVGEAVSVHHASGVPMILVAFPKEAMGRDITQLFKDEQLEVVFPGDQVDKGSTEDTVNDRFGRAVEHAAKIGLMGTAGVLLALVTVAHEDEAVMKVLRTLVED